LFSSSVIVVGADPDINQTVTVPLRGAVLLGGAAVPVPLEPAQPAVAKMSAAAPAATLSQRFTRVRPFDARPPGQALQMV
jgi:hypothetical protein